MSSMPSLSRSVFAAGKSYHTIETVAEKLRAPADQLKREEAKRAIIDGSTPRDLEKWTPAELRSLRADIRSLLEEIKGMKQRILKEPVHKAIVEASHRLRSFRIFAGEVLTIPFGQLIEGTQDDYQSFGTKSLLAECHLVSFQERIEEVLSEQEA